jgi:hypothetical protein
MTLLSLNRIRHSLRRWKLERRQALLPDLRERYAHMFIQDTVNSLLPFRNAPAVDFNVELTVTPPSKEEVIRQAFGERYSHRDNANIAEFVRDSARILLARGLVTFWSESISRKSDPTEAQIVVRCGDLASWALPHPGRLKRDLVKVRLPQYIGSGYPRMMREFSRLSGPLFPEFVTSDHFTNQRHFDTDHYRKTETASLLEVTRLTGWSVRGRLSGELLEYYVLERFLRFEKFKAELRGVLLSGINQLLAMIGERDGFGAGIELKGLASVSDVAQARAKLCAGNLPFNEIIKPFMWY